MSHEPRAEFTEAHLETRPLFLGILSEKPPWPRRLRKWWSKQQAEPGRQPSLLS